MTLDTRVRLVVDSALPVSNGTAVPLVRFLRRPPQPTIAPEEIRRARRELSLTRAEYAERIGASEAEVAAWEEGRIPVPPDEQHLIEVDLYFARADAVLEREGIRPCEELEVLSGELSIVSDRVLATMPPESGDIDALGEITGRMDRHRESCAACIARRECLERHGVHQPEMPKPRGLLMRLFHASEDWPIPQAAKVGAALVAFKVAVPALLFIAIGVLTLSPEQVLGGVALATLPVLSGGLGGLCYHAVRRGGRQRGWRHYVASIIGVGGYFAAIALLLMIGERFAPGISGDLGREATVESALVAGSLVALIFGIAVGWITRG